MGVALRERSGENVRLRYRMDIECLGQKGSLGCLKCMLGKPMYINRLPDSLIKCSSH